MCGIFGILSLNGQPIPPEAIQTGLTQLHHRGPDIQTTWLSPDGQMALGHARLSIIDLSPEGNQPFANEDGSIQVVANGEIYNYAELKKQLLATGHQFKSLNDCETLPHLYETDGEKLFNRLDGMFACAIWDGQQLLLGRDPFGKKPLFYHYQPGKHLVFASEIKALLPFLSHRSANSNQVLNYFANGYTVGIDSIFSGIQAVPAGGTLCFDTKTQQLKTSLYWTWPTTIHVTPPSNAQKWVEQFRETFLQAVEKRLMADVPLGAFLSGGIDSCSVVAAMHAISPETERHTFSIHFEEASYDTYDHIHTLVERFNLKHHRVPFTANDFTEWFEPVMQKNDGLLADLSLLPMHKLATEAGKTLKVVLTGDGADELLAGYDTYKASRLAQQIGVFRPLLGGLCDGAARLWPADTHRKKLNLSVLLRQMAHGLTQPNLSLTHARWRQIFTFSDLHELLSPEGQALLTGKPSFPDSTLYQEAWQKTPGDWLLKAQTIDVQHWMRDSILPKVDRSTMAASLEARSPFLDQDLATLVAQLPAHLKTRHPKWLLREAMTPYLPPEVIWQKKSGFNTPISRWLIEEPDVRQLAEHWLLSDTALQHGLLNRPQVLKLWQRHQYQDCHLKLWNLMVFNAWHYYHLESGPAANTSTPMSCSV